MVRRIPDDGTICAFAPNDGAWAEGGDLRTLFDLYSVWALRHLYLEVFGLWPGKQYALLGPLALQVHYRLSECKDDELCGCGSETLRYADCCKPEDLKWNRLQLIEHFLRAIPGGFASRKPPAQVADFIEGGRPSTDRRCPSISCWHPLTALRWVALSSATPVTVAMTARDKLNSPPTNWLSPTFSKVEAGLIA